MATAPSLPSPRRPQSRPPLSFPPPRHHSILALWHLLSLDAPTVAALWTFFLARADHLYLPASSVAAMATAVWLLYAADRLLDARLLDARAGGHHTLEARHRFHHRHRRAFRLGIAAAALALAALLPTLDPAAIRLYLIEGSFLVGYFLIIHATTSDHRIPKELAVGLFFAAATFIPTIARQAALRLPLIAPALLLSALCSLNCLFIYAWEHPSPGHPKAHPTTRLALRHLHPIALTLLAAALAFAALDHRAPTQIAAAIALSAAALLTLHHHRHHLHPTTLRAAADLALLTPFLFLLR